ncbi:MAG: sulfatase-like hydrolase/transferase [Planctomycetes bacterium]|nr:sulfatase-like hydrolase/transferase [Planctomycetota bacterium]
MSRPNYIVFLTDDQGYGDLSCMGATDLRTPHLDALAAGGARFTDFYANSAVCSPTRASLMTGCYPGNAGVRSILAGHRTATGLPAGVPTLASILRAHGYRTFMAGKWHLGMAEASRPGAKGFDRWFGFLAGCIDYYSHIFYWGMNKPGPGVNPAHDLWEDGREVWRNGEYFTTAVTRKAVEYLRDASREGKPFLLYVAYNAPHYPMHAPAETMERFAHLPWDRQVMAAMISAVDDGVGAVMAETARLGLAENTCTFFLSDNGPSRESRNWLDGTLDPYYGGTTGRLKGHKFSLYDGGIRVPAICHWPGTIPPGQVISTPAASMDILPTCLAGADIDPNDHVLDGADLLPLVAGGRPPAARDLFWELGDQTALRSGDWKLVLNGRLVEGGACEGAVHLANLADDPGETRNLAAAEPERTEAMKAAALAWREGIEQRWQREFDPAAQGTVTHRDP